MAREVHKCVGCGAKETVIGRNRADAERKLEWFKENRPYCFDCRRAQELEKSKSYAVDTNLPKLQGTDKQIAYAETLRAQRLLKLDKIVAHAGGEETDLHVTHYTVFVLDLIEEVGSPMFLRAIGALRHITDAHWWIEKREAGDAALIKRLIDDMHDAPLDPVEHERLEVDAMVEATIRPADPVTETVAEIRTGDPRRLTIVLPEKHEDFRLLVKSYGFRWNQDHWTLPIPSDPSITTVGRSAAEIGRALLADDFIVRVLDPEIRTMIETGEFEQPKGKIVRYLGKEKVGISWRRADGDFYAAAKGVKGAKWSKEQQLLVVPVTSADEIRDFADRADFHLLAGTVQAFEAFDRYRADGMVVSVEKGRKPGKFKLERCAVAPDAIDEDLRDDLEAA